MFRVKSGQDFGAGVMFMLIGIAGIYFGKDLTYGSAIRMGPGFFPVWLSWIIIGLGAIIGLRGLSYDGPPIEMPQFRPLFMILLAIVIFGYVVEQVGLAITTIVLTLIAAYARDHREVSLKEQLIFGVCMGIALVIAFVYILGQPLPPWWGIH
jgi:hypothetical protein